MTLPLILTLIAVAIACVFLARWALANVVFDVLKKSIPPVSQTEQDAIDAGTLSYEQGIFRGQPDWEHLLKRDMAKLSPAEQDFMNMAVPEIMEHLNDFDVRSHRDLPPTVWNLLRKRGFFGLIVPKQYGGLDFSATAISKIVSTVGAKSFACGITIMVPSSLGPAKLLLKFGTETQKNHYLPKLATGEFIPCFALTGVTSGSDAGTMRDVGIVTKIGRGKNAKLGIRASFSKRYITLAPVANLIGLAIDVYDPDGLLGDDYPYVNPTNKQVGITVALLNRDQDGVTIGNRHLPTGLGFMNGSIRGKNVLIDFDQVIGGRDQLGQGWVMLMSCLGVGRAISLPAIASAGTSWVACYTALYAGMRKQFNLPIARMEGVAEKLSDSLHLHFINDSAKHLATTMVDDGENPAVASALIKYATTTDMQDCMSNCMDILGGKAICDGPTNRTMGAYLGIPIAITVEGANILTRTLITFSQGALRAHPYLFAEIQCLYDADETQARKKFATTIGKHMGFTVGLTLCNLWHNATRGVFLQSPNGVVAPKHYYRHVTVQAKQFALLSDMVLLVLGGRIKSKQMVSGRLADILKNLYYAMAILKRFETHFEKTGNTALRPLLDYAIARMLHENVQLMRGVVANLPFAPLRGFLRVVLCPLGLLGMGVGHTAPSDKMALSVTRAVYDNPDILRTLFADVFDSGMVDEIYTDYAVLQDAQTLYKKLKPLVKSGEIVMGYDTDWRDMAHKNGHITTAERDILKQAESVYFKHMNVDEFTTDGKTYQGVQDTDLAHQK